MRSSLVAFALAVVSFASPLARAGDGEPQAVRGLLLDLERIVAAEESGWFFDADKYRAMYPNVLESVCRAPPSARAAALAILDRRLAATGDPRTLFEARGLDGQVEDALFLSRQRHALEMAIAGAAADCPFWVRPDPDFKGRQIDWRRLTFSLETGGIVQLRQTEGQWTYGGGGNGRALLGYGVAEHISLLGGIEFGGGAMLEPGYEPSRFVINYFPAIPVVVRLRAVSWHLDLESAAVALFQADNTNFSYGIRGGIGIGVSALRTRNLLPWAGVAIAYEHYFPGGERETLHFLRGGLRVGLRWDP